MKQCKKCKVPLGGFFFNIAAALFGIKPSQGDPEVCNRCDTSNRHSGTMQIHEIFQKSPGVFDFKSFDLSTWSLVFANLLTIIMALVENWNLSVVMLIYWFQSVIIGIFNVARIVTFTGFQQLDKTEDKRGARLAAIFLAGFFAVHYGGFHWGYWSFIRNWTRNIDLENGSYPVGDFLFKPPVFIFV